MEVRKPIVRTLVPLCVAVLLAACGGGESSPAQPVPPAPTPTAPVPPGVLIGAAGGTVSGPNGASVVIPAGALSTEVRINIERITTGAPALPAGLTAIGPMFAFTPHGTTFALPVTMTLPFDPANVPANFSPAFLKTLNGQTQWERVASPSFGAGSVSARVTSFSDATVATEPFTLGDVGRKWTFNTLHGFGAQAFFLQGAEVSGGQLSEFRDFGLGNFDAEFSLIDGRIITPDGRANGAIGASADGKSLYVAAESPLQNANVPGVPIGSQSILVQVQTFTKRNDIASLTFSLPQTVIDAHDENAALGRECPENRVFEASGDQPELCILINGLLSIELEAFTPDGTVAGNPVLGPARRFFSLSGIVELTGFAESWEFISQTNSSSRIPLWNREDFRLVVEDLDALTESHALLTLINQPTHTVNISSIGVGETFHVRVTAKASAYNLIAGPPSERRTSVGAYLRESLAIGGGILEFSGLELVDTPLPLPEPPPTEEYVLPVVCAGSPSPAAGSIQFTAPGYSMLESGSPSTITVARTGGSVGAVTATFTTSDGTAIAGADYTAVHSTVFFADGDTTPRVVQVPIIHDPTAGQPDKTVNLTLTEPGNCSAIGAQSAAVLTIRDADAPPPPPEFTVGGTVTGLAGEGLVLQDLHFVPIAPAANGPFTFTLPTQTGQAYAVTILTQPSNPIQVCTVNFGSGIVTNANITHVEVNCITPPPSGALDPSFGGTGKVSTAFGGIGTDMALQGDGTIVMVGDAGTDFVLALYGADGSLERTVTTGIAAGNDEAHGVAIQPADNKILVVGSARVGSTDDFAVVRYDADGTIDNSFGTLGKVTTDFIGGIDEAHGVVVQPDGKIVVVGSTSRLGVVDFAVARYLPDGTLDATFDTDGRQTIDIAGGVDLGRNVVLQGDAILVSGVITMGGSPVLGNTGLARFTASGALDAGFAAGLGKKNLPNLALGEGLALQADGKILVAGNVPAIGGTQFGLMRLDANGGADGSFGAQGLVTTPFTTRDDYGYAVAVQADDKIVVAGESGNLASPDFAVARYDVNGTLDPTFDVDGKLIIDFFGSRDGGRAVVVQPDGRIVLGGFATNAGSVGFGLVRVNP